MTGRRGRRRAGILPTIGLVVEGDVEHVAIPSLHTDGRLHGVPPMRSKNLGGLGLDLTPSAIAKRIAPKVIAHVAAGRKRVIVCIDREERTACAPALAKGVATALDGLIKGRCNGDVSVVVADRTFEAWLLADPLGLVALGLFERSPATHRFEGSLGKELKKGVVELSEALGRPYAKTRDGPRLFANLDLSNARDHAARGSRSLDKLLRELGV